MVVSTQFHKIGMVGLVGLVGMGCFFLCGVDERT